MINKIKAQTLSHLDEILSNAQKMANATTEDERMALYQAIEHACFQTRTLVNDLSFVISNDYVKKTNSIEIEEDKQANAVPSDKGNKKKYVLIAEDVDCNFLLASLVLKKHYRVERAKNGREAVEMVDRELPDIVLMDIKMPVMDGYEACNLIKKKYPTLPIVAVTAYTQMEEEANIIKQGFDGFLPKPLNLGAFTKLVAEKLKI